jgi:hypothetical protein
MDADPQPTIENTEIKKPPKTDNRAPAAAETISE